MFRSACTRISAALGRWRGMSTSAASALSPDTRLRVVEAQAARNAPKSSALHSALLQHNLGRVNPEVVVKYPNVLKVLSREKKIRDLSYTDRVALSVATYNNKSHAGRAQRKKAARKALQARVDARVRELQAQSKEMLMQRERERQVKNVNAVLARKARKAARLAAGEKIEVPTIDWSQRAAPESKQKK